MANKTKDEVYRKCKSLEKYVTTRNLADDSEIEEYRPGDKVGDGTKTEWWTYQFHLGRFLGREDNVPSQKEIAEDEILKVANDEPETLTLLRPVGDTQIVKIHPKSARALMWMDAHDWALEFFYTRREAIRQLLEQGQLREDMFDDPPEVLIRKCADEISYHLSCMSYGATRPGPSIDIEDAENPPEEFLEMGTLDLLMIHKKFMEVNGERIALLRHLMGDWRGQAEGDEPISWSVFLSHAAKQQGKSIVEVSRNQSLASLLVQLNLATPQLEDELD